jgi:nicotinamide riboside transporter PnuC
MGLLALLVALGERDDKVMAALAAVFGALCLIVAAMAAF